MRGTPLRLMSAICSCFNDQRYRWTPQVKGIGQPLYVDIESFNGESARIGSKGAAIPRDNRPIPSVLEVGWIPPGGAGLRVVVTLDEAETFAAFQKLLQGDQNKSLTLLVETSVSGAEVSLKDNQFLLSFKAARSKVWAL